MQNLLSGRSKVAVTILLALALAAMAAGVLFDQRSGGQSPPGDRPTAIGRFRDDQSLHEPG